MKEIEEFVERTGKSINVQVARGGNGVIEYRLSNHYDDGELLEGWRQVDAQIYVSEPTLERAWARFMRLLTGTKR